MKKKSVAGKVAIITGGASGIGRALGEELASRGCEVVLADRQIEAAQEIVRGIESKGGKAVAAEIDVRDLPALQKLVKDTVTRSGHVDLFFNNAGIGVGGEMANYDAEDFDDVFDVNLRGVAYGILAVYPQMIAQGSGHIINTASILGLVCGPNNGSYAAAKHAVVALSKSLRIEAAHHGVDVSVVCPGAILTPILTGGRYGRTNVEGATDADILKMWERTRPMDPAVFARKVVDRVISKQAIIVVPGWWKALWYLDRISPMLSMRLWRKLGDDMRAEMATSGFVMGRKEKKKTVKNGEEAHA